MIEYNIQYNIGKVKYVVNWHDGIKTHKDGSKFFDVACFNSKERMNKFVAELKNKSCPHCNKMVDESGYCTPCGTYKQLHKELFHVFTDGRDEWLPKKTKALKLGREWAKENGCARVYHETEWNETEGIFEDGDCIYSKGSYPY